MIIYIDVLFFINLISDYILLTLADRIIFAEDISFFSKKNLKKLISAVFGAVYSCLILLEKFNFLFTLPAKITFFVLMCAAAYLPCSLDSFVKKCASFLILSVFFCGLFHTVKMIFAETADLLLISAFLSGFYIIKSCFDYFRKQLNRRDISIKIYYNKKSITVSGIMDTGNSLKEPSTGFPVLMADEKTLSRLFEADICRNNLCEFIKPEDFKVIPYKTISEHGVTFGFIPDKLIFKGKNFKNTVVAIAPSSIDTDIILNSLLI